MLRKINSHLKQSTTKKQAAVAKIYYMERIEGKLGEKVLVTASYKCTAHDDSWFSFNQHDTFKLCPRCRNEHKTETTWFSFVDAPAAVKNRKPQSSFLSFVKSILPF